MEITFGASTAIKAPFLPPRKTHFSTKHENVVFFPCSTSLFSSRVQAKAFTLPKEEIVSSLTQVEGAINQMEEKGSSFMENGQQIYYDSVKPSIDAAIDTAVPMVQHAGEDAFNAASPVITNAIKMAQDAVQSSGFNSESVVNAAKSVTSVAGQKMEEMKPIASSTVETISKSDPLLIAESAVGLFIAYLFLPSVVSAISSKLRGYKGSLTPTQALNLTSTHNFYLIDIRSKKDKNKADNNLKLPSTAKSLMIEIPLQELSIRLRRRLKNAKKMEAEMVALKISYLNHLTKSTNIVIIDSNSGSAKLVAKTLTSFGFKNCWIMTDGV